MENKKGNIAGIFMILMFIGFAMMVMLIIMGNITDSLGQVSNVSNGFLGDVSNIEEIEFAGEMLKIIGNFESNSGGGDTNADEFTEKNYNQ